MSIKESTPTEPITIVGGGPKKVLYTLKTVARIGLLNSAKALNSKNACKACGLGMGGQRGGMTNEKDEFPSVCNKSIQAQSTDIQQPIPTDLFNHTLDDFKQLSAYELEHLGRLNNPLFKSTDSNKYSPVSWEFALDKMARAFTATDPERSFFYSSGRSSNEAGFVLQLLARLYGTNNVNNCSYYCHQATGVGLSNVIGTGTATVSLEDVGNCDCIFVIGANPSSNHPRFVHQLKNCRERGGQVIVINPAKEPGLVRFAVPKSAKSMLSGGSWIASEYEQPKIGSDLALFKGIAKALLEKHQIATNYIAQYTSDFETFKHDIEHTTWPTLVSACGIEKEKIIALADAYARADKAIFAWGMGITHHLHGVENVEAIANLALLRGMLGKPAAGLLPLRGHSNVQGIGTVGVKPILADDVLQQLEQHLNVQLPRSKGMDTLACLDAAHAGKIDAAFIMGGNLFSATPNSKWAQAALDKINFKVYLTTTLNAGHITGMETSEALILPVTARDEEWQPTTQESMFNYVRLSDGGIDRLHNVKPEVEILCELGRRLLPNCPLDFNQLKQHDSIRAAIAATIPGLSELKDIAKTKQEFTIKDRLFSTPVFKTENGKAQFQTNPLPAPVTSAEYPFLLASIRSEGQFNSIIYEESDSYRGTNTRWSILMNQADIDALGIKVNDSVDVQSAQGEMKAVKVFAFDLPRGNAMAYYPEANVLIATTHDPRSKTPAFKSVPVQIRNSGSTTD
ncbi:FdhF/YdeP family oxidoreductase [Cellvibrio sp. OA-2007]|uniref:FdhF/YdeP family oxidoreductase n=1 Tax=Cellvibrio sp. OA-2007 TaxID=529823 RepID=UPI000780EA3A|nr:FdhF/YdeP family oxidoreductase [Cellvibrio sp. OA-2007]